MILAFTVGQTIALCLAAGVLAVFGILAIFSHYDQ
jgi:hypothetical protein